mgnify:CR=1 FL=1
MCAVVHFPEGFVEVADTATNIRNLCLSAKYEAYPRTKWLYMNGKITLEEFWHSFDDTCKPDHCQLYQNFNKEYIYYWVPTVRFQFYDKIWSTYFELVFSNFRTVNANQLTYEQLDEICGECPTNIFVYVELVHRYMNMHDFHAAETKALITKYTQDSSYMRTHNGDIDIKISEIWKKLTPFALTKSAVYEEQLAD